MNKTGPQLLELSPEEGFSIQEKYVAADTLYSQIKEDVKKRAVALDEAISQSTQVLIYTRNMTGFFQIANSGAHKDIFWDILIKFQLTWFHYIIFEYGCLGLSEVILAWVQSLYFLPAYKYSKKCFSDFRNTQLSSLSKCLSKCPSRVVCNICQDKRKHIIIINKILPGRQ